MRLPDLEQLLDDNGDSTVTSTAGFYPELRSYTPVYVGKVRDVYDFGSEVLLVASDRISTFDLNHPNAIPGKGIILTQMTLDFAQAHRHRVPIAHMSEDLPEPFDEDPRFKGRSIIMPRFRMVPFEAVVRGYLYGSAWEEYKKYGTVAGLQMPRGMVEAQKLDEPIFTPATKVEKGNHDINVDFSYMEDVIGASLAEEIRDESLRAFARGSVFAELRGVIIADTKFEFGVDKSGFPWMVDEIMTPDSSRFWPADQYQPGGKQPSLDKQYVREYVDSIGWNRKAPAPVLPDEVVRNTALKYREVAHMLLR